jgi:hypothetical protein
MAAICSRKKGNQANKGVRSLCVELDNHRRANYETMPPDEYNRITIEIFNEHYYNKLINVSQGVTNLQVTLPV